MKKKTNPYRNKVVVNSLPALEVVEHVPEKVVEVKKSAVYKYTVVSAVYNIARYLNQFFESIEGQSIDFTKSVQLVMVDDGSVDESAAIIKKWVALYPKNIKYVYQQNAGQGAARNLGIEYAKNDWITFIDPDDFLDPEYFEKIDSTIVKHSSSEELKALCANYIFYYEDVDVYSDTHPLRYRFANDKNIVSIHKMDKNISLNVNSVFFKRSRILDKEIRFNANIRPGFEDSHFTNNYFLSLDDGMIAFVPGAKYYYRKREDGSSTLDTAWSHPGRYDTQIRLGNLGIISESIKRFGIVLPYIQRTVLYDLSWHFKRLINHDEKLSHLTSEQKEIYKSLVEEVMSHISVETIMSFDLSGIWFYQKLGLLKLYKNYTPDFNIVYIDGIDQIKNLVKIRYFTTQMNGVEQFRLDGNLSVPVFQKTRRHSFLGQLFVYERIVWLAIGDHSRMDIDVGPKTRVSIGGKQHHKGVALKDVRAQFNRRKLNEATLPSDVVELRAAATSLDSIRSYGDCWLFMDRDVKADDNAEHLYEYVKQNHPDINSYFIISRNCPDWLRLENKGFRLIDFDSMEHKCALVNAAHFISSHADEYIFSGINKKSFVDLVSYRFTFLQHGVTKDDLSSWLNSKVIDCFVTATAPEMRSIAEDGNYKFTSKDVVLTGFPRHDRLRSLSHLEENSILIMPTWRNHLVGSATGNGNEREINPNFSSSEFAQQWKSFLHSEVVFEQAKQGYKVIFAPHINLVPYIDVFDLPSHVSLYINDEGESIQCLIARTKILVTDYSSIAFEVAALFRSVIYFQFDAAEVFGGHHTYQPGYYSYKNDGFGPVCSTVDELGLELLASIGRNGTPREEYMSRMHNTFAFDDQKNCLRTFDAIQRLDRSTVTRTEKIPAALAHAERSMRQGQWVEAIHAWNCVSAFSNEHESRGCYEKAIAYRNLGEFPVAMELIDKAAELGFCKTSIILERLTVAVLLEDHVAVDRIYESNKFEFAEADSALLVLIIKSKRMRGEISEALELLDGMEGYDDVQLIRERAELSSLSESWVEAKRLWRQYLDSHNDADAAIKYAKACRLTGDIVAAVSIIKEIAKLPDNDLTHNEVAEIEYAQLHWKQACLHWEKVKNTASRSADEWLKYAKALRKTGKYSESREALQLAEFAVDSRTYHQEQALLASASSDWKKSVAAWEAFLGKRELKPNRDAWLHLAQASYNDGDQVGALRALRRFEGFGEITKKSKALRSILETHLEPESA